MLIYVRTAYRCRAYPTSAQAAVLERTFGCARLVWNKALAERDRRYRVDGKRTSYRETDALLTAWKRTEGLAFLSEVSSVPLQQTLHHQHVAFRNFFAGRTRHPRFKSRNGRRSAHYTRSAFRMREGALTLAKMSAPLDFVWSFDQVDITALHPTMVVVSRDPDGRWYVTFAVDTDDAKSLPATGHEVGVDLGLKYFLVTSDGDRVLAELELSVRHWTCHDCRTHHDRDLNAAKNILAAGRVAVRGDPGDACGADVRRQGPSLPRSATKQETRTRGGTPGAAGDRRHFRSSSNLACKSFSATSLVFSPVNAA
jgi:transposase